MPIALNARRFVRLALILLVPVVLPAHTTACGSSTSACCRVCSTGKACGDSCIARDAVCNTPGGCACNS
jgi:hypothetical protein